MDLLPKEITDALLVVGFLSITIAAVWQRIRNIINAIGIAITNNSNWDLPSWANQLFPAVISIVLISGVLYEMNTALPIIIFAVFSGSFGPGIVYNTADLAGRSRASAAQWGVGHEDAEDYPRK